MRIYHNQLQQALTKNLGQAWLIFGDEPWQKIDSLDSLKQTATAQGYDELIRFSADDKFDWQIVADEFQTLSLFSTRRIIEVDMGERKIDEKANAFLTQLAENLTNQPIDDTLLILHGAKLDSNATRKKWFKAFDKIATYLPLYELEGKAINQWLYQRIKHYQLAIDNQSQQLLIDFFEGNIPSLEQELQKLNILFDKQQINIDQLEQLLIKQAKFNPFQLIDALLFGKLDKALAMLNQQQQEGVAPAQIIWILHKELSQLLIMLEQINQGANKQDLYKQYRIWDKRKPLYNYALANISLGNIKVALKRLAQTDLVSKTSAEFNSFILLADICCSVYFGDKTKHLDLNLDYHD